MKKTLAINAHLKYVEFLLSEFDNAPNERTIGEIRDEFKTKFSTLHPLLNQHFGIYRLLPLILIKEDYIKANKELEGDIETIKIIRDAIAHNNFEINSEGYSFKSDKNEKTLSYDEFVEFVHKIENDFYNDKNATE